MSSSSSSPCESDDDQRPLRVGEKVRMRAYARAYMCAFQRCVHRPLRAGEGYVEGRVVHRSCAEGRRCQ
jgi:hypothetical protein